MLNNILLDVTDIIQINIIFNIHHILKVKYQSSISLYVVIKNITIITFLTLIKIL